MSNPDEVRLSNARIGDRVVDLLIENGHITEISPHRGGGIDLGGRWVVPGLWDEHVHFTQWAMYSQRIELSAASSAGHAATLVGNAIRAGTGALAVGAGFRDSMWADAPTRQLLDANTGGVPTVLVSADLHSVWLNSTALAQYGFAAHPTGLLTEADAFEVTRQLDTVPETTVDSWALAAAAAAAARGVVGIVDFEMAWNLGVWQRRVDSGHDAMRVELILYTEHLDRAISEGLRSGQRFAELLELGRFKVLADGSLNTRTAYTHDEYAGSFGSLALPVTQLEYLMRTAADAGIALDIHAIGDRANTIALDTFEAIGVGGRIEHAQLLARADYPRFASLGVTASMQPEHGMDDRDVADRYWAGRTDRMLSFRTLLDSGAHVVFGSDAPVSHLDPWLGIAAAVGRSRDGREPWHPEQRITNAEALRASSRTTVAVGQIADLVVVELDPLRAGHDELRRMPVAATLLGGRFTHDAL